MIYFYFQQLTDNREVHKQHFIDSSHFSHFPLSIFETKSEPKLVISSSQLEQTKFHIKLNKLRFFARTRHEKWLAREPRCRKPRKNHCRSNSTTNNTNKKNPETEIQRKMTRKAVPDSTSPAAKQPQSLLPTIQTSQEKQ